MSDFIDVIINFLENIIQFDIFLYFIGAFLVLSVILLFRKLVYG